MARNEIKTRLSANARGFNTTLKQSTRNIKEFSRSARNSRTNLAKLNKSTGLSRKLLRGLGGVALGAFAVKAGRDVLNLDERLRKLGAQANLTLKQINQDVKPRIFDVAKARGKTPEQVLAGIEAVVERIGQPKFALAVADTIAKVSKGTSSAAEDIGATIANLRDKLKLDPDEILAFLDVLIAQGKEGSFTLENLSRFSDRLTASMVAIGVTTDKGRREFGAFLQLAKRTSGEPARAVTAIEGVVTRIVTQADELQAAGFQIFDPVLLAQGVRKFRDFGDIIKDIIERTGGREGILKNIVGEEPLRGLRGVLQSLQQTPKEFDRFANLGGDLSNVNRDFDLLFGAGTTKISNLNTEVQRLTDSILKLPIDKLADSLGKIADILEQFRTFTSITPESLKKLQKQQEISLLLKQADPGFVTPQFASTRQIFKRFEKPGGPLGKTLLDSLNKIFVAGPTTRIPQIIDPSQKVNQAILNFLQAGQKPAPITNNINITIDEKGTPRVTNTQPGVTNTVKVRKKLTSGEIMPNGLQ